MPAVPGRVASDSIVVRRVRMGQHDTAILPQHDLARGAMLPARRYSGTIAAAIRERQQHLGDALGQLALRAPVLAEVASSVIGALRSGRQVLVAGNGGSAAETQHFVAELVGRFRRERRPYAVVALTADTAILTAVA